MKQLLISETALKGHPQVMSSQFHDFEDDYYPGIEEMNSSFSAAGIIPALADMVGDVVKTLPSLGIGSKSRRKETETTAYSQLSLIQAQEVANNERAADQQKMMVIGGAFLLIIVVVVAATR